jgi:hypothetical protein
MSIVTLRNGKEYSNVTVLLPLSLRDFAKERNISMSRLLRLALEEQYNDYSASEAKDDIHGAK